MFRGFETVEDHLYTNLNSCCFQVETLRRSIIGFSSQNESISINFEEYDCHLADEYPEWLSVNSRRC